MDRDTFINLPLSQLAEHVRETGPKVCAFPINGTRRWFILEYPEKAQADFINAYFDIAAKRHTELYKLLFEHGIDILLTPVFGPDLQSRGEEYMQMAADGLALLTEHPVFLDFYHTHEVRVRFYGDYRKFFSATSHAYLPDMFDRLAEQTAAFNRYRLYFGVCAQDAAETTAELSVAHYKQHGRPPDKRTLVELYYGDYVPPVDLFIGFDKFCAFDMPLVATGSEDLYFTVAPSPYLTPAQLRDILYDHLFGRPNSEPDYAAMNPEDWALMRQFYQANEGNTLGVGAKRKRQGYWYPLPQVKLPAGFEEKLKEGG